MKRNKNLHPLSWDHHAALTSVVFTRMQINNNADQARLQQIATEYAAFYQIGLLPHFRHEEEWLLPRYLRHASPDDTDVVRLLTEHVHLHRLVLDLADAAAGSRNLVDPLVRLTDLLETHVRFEERILFPKIEAALTSEESGELGKFLWENAPESVIIPGGDGCKVKISGVEDPEPET